MSFYGCQFLMDLSLNINGRIDTNEKNVALCCSKLPKGIQKPAIALEGTAEEVLKRFIETRNNVISYSKKEGNNANKIGKDEWLGCKWCGSFKKNDWEVGELIKTVNLSMYPAPCQCYCSYCIASRKWENTPEVNQAYEKLFEVIELADKKGLISPEAEWQISSGEITIHPYRDRILNLVKNKKAIFFTNAFIYDDDIANILAENKNSRINISIDAGTPQTWKKIKGVDNFNEVCDNLIAYSKASSNINPIQLKYIIIPGINDNEEDYKELIRIMNNLGISHLTISRDVEKIQSISKKDSQVLIKSAARLATHCLRNNITIGLSTYTFEECRKVRMLIRSNRLKNIFKKK